MECLVRVWQPPLTAAGFQIVRPTVTIYGDEINTKCGKCRRQRLLLPGRPADLLEPAPSGGDLVPIVARTSGRPTW